MNVYLSLHESPQQTCGFSYYDSGQSIRHVLRVLEEGRWVFSAKGKVISGESSDDYKRGRIVDRITVESVYGIAKQNGFDLDEINFSSQEAVSFYEMRK